MKVCKQVVAKEMMDSFIKVELVDEECFLKIKETLTRIGIMSKKDRTLYQSCHILHKRGSYYIMHFKEMFYIDGKHSTLDDMDIKRRNAICLLLEDWNLVRILNRKLIDSSSLKNLTILPFKDKNNYTLTPKYTIGKK